MKRWIFLCAGWALVVMAAVNLTDRLSTLFGSPLYHASAFVKFNGRRAPQNLELISRPPGIVSSTNVLYPVVESLKLSEKWENEFGGRPLSVRNSYQYLLR